MSHIPSYADLLHEVEELRERTDAIDPSRIRMLFRALSLALEPILGFDQGDDPPQIDAVRKALGDLQKAVDELGKRHVEI